MMRPSSVRWGPGGFGAFSKRQGPSLREGGGCLLIPLRVESLQDASHPPFERGQGRRGRVAVRGGRDVPCLRLRMVPTLAAKRKASGVVCKGISVCAGRHGWVQKGKHIEQCGFSVIVPLGGGKRLIVFLVLCATGHSSACPRPP